MLAPMPSTRRPLFALAALLLLCGAGAACVSRMVAMPGASFSGPPPPLDAEGRVLEARLAAHVQVLAERIGERNVPASPERLEAAAQYVSSSPTPATR